MESAQTQVEKAPFGSMADGAAVGIWTLTSDRLEVKLCEFGARIVSILAPGRDGTRVDVTLGLKTLAEYVEDRNTFLGAIVGRFGNRIAGGRFSLGGRTFQVPPNDGPNALHGGPEGFDRVVWTAEPIAGGVAMRMVSPDGDQGFPGTLHLEVRYTLEGGALRLEYCATSDQDTVINVTNHAYFNLAGESSGTILEHEIRIPAGRYTPTDAKLIPTGELAPVEGTPFDFRASTVIGKRIEDDNQQLERAGGYDHNWVLTESAGTMKLAARLKDAASGRVLTVETTEPGVQFYSGNFLNGSLPNREGTGTYARRTGLCLETQHFPDSPNQAGFASTLLAAGETRRSVTVLTFDFEQRPAEDDVADRH